MRTRPLRIRGRALAALLLLPSLAFTLHASPACLDTGNATFLAASDFAVEIDGITVCTEFDQLVVTGTVTIDTSATLSISGSHTPAVGNSFILISNDSTDPISGNFSGMPENSTISNFMGSGHLGRVTYAGGTDSNDMVITVEIDPNDPPVVNAIVANDVTTAGATAYSFTVTYTDDSQIINSTVSVNNVTVTGAGAVLVTTASTDAPGDVSPKTATYIVTPPGGAWDPADDGLYTIGIVGSQVGDDGATQLFVAADPSAATFTVNIAPDIAVSGNGTDIANGDTSPSLADHTDFGGAQLLNVTVDRTFTVTNNGTLDLTLTGATPVTLSGTGAGDYTILTQPSSPLASGGTSTFTVQFDPSAAGLRTATLSIANDDPDEAPFTFDIQGSDPNFDRISEAGGDGDHTVDATRPSVARGGNGFLVVWDEPAGIYGQFVTDANGTVGPDFEISTNPLVGPIPQRDFPDVSFNSTDSQWMVVWQENSNPGGATEYEIFAQVIDANGNKLHDPPIRVSDMGADGTAANDAFEPAVAYDSTHNQFLVVWSGDDAVDADEEIYGQLLQADGTATGPNDFRISDMGVDGNPAHQAQLPDVVFNEPNGVFMVAWEGDDAVDGDFAIFAQFVSTLGTESGSDFAFGAAPAHDVSIIVDQDTAGFFAFWEGAAQIRGQRLDDAGAEIDADDFVVSSMAVEGINPAVAASPTRAELYVFWEGDNGGGELEIYRQTLSGSGALLGGVAQVSNQGPGANANFAAQTPAVAIGQDVFVVWSGDTNVAPLVDEEFEIFAALSIVPPNLLINEVDVSQAASGDAEEFIELRNASGQTVNLDAWELQLSSGGTVDLPDVDLAPGAFYVICTNGGRTPNCDLDITPDVDLISDGPAGITLVYNGVVADALAWNGFTTAPFVEGTAAAADPGATQDFISLSRLVIDQHNNSLDFALRCATPGLVNSANSSGCANPLVADLAIAATDSPDPISVGQTLTYTVSVSNSGPHTALDVAVALNVPTGLTFGAASGTGWTCSESGGLVTCTLPNLAIGAANDISITGTYNGAAASLNTSAVVSSWAHDPDTADNTALLSTLGGAEIAVSGNGNDIADGSTVTSATNDTAFGGLVAGATADATFTVQNLGGLPLTLDAASLTASLASSTEFVLLANFGSTTLSANDSAPGGTDETTFTIQFAPTAAGAFTHTVSFDNSDGDESPFTFLIGGSALSVPVETGDGLHVVENGVTDIYTVGLGTTPVGAVEITATGNADVELSLDGINFSPSVTVSTADTTAHTITVRASDDADFEGPETHTITHAITTSADPDYPLSFVIADASVLVGDDDGADITLHDDAGTIEILDGDTSPRELDGTDFGAVRNGTIDRNFQVGNIGTVDLTITSVTLVGPSSGDFSVTAQPAGPIANGNSDTITILFQPTAAGVHEATVEIVNSDSSESPYRFAISATSHQKIIVTTLDDEDDGDPHPALGAGTSLREAIEFANIAPGPDEICFQAGLNGTVLLNSLLPTIVDPLTIDGNTDANVATEDITLDGFSSYRVLRVDDANLTLRHLRIQNGMADGSGGAGESGGGIWANHSTSLSILTLETVHLSQNSASEGAAIYQQNGALIATNSTFTDNNSGVINPGPGGGVRVVSTLTDFLTVDFTSCTFESNNSVTSGGAVSLDAAHSNLTFNSTFFFNNSAFQNGSAVHIEDSNAAVDGIVHLQLNSCYLLTNFGGSGTVHAELAGNDQLQVNIEQSCFFDNDAIDNAGGVVLISGSNGTYSLINSTFSDNEANGTEALVGGLLLANGTTTLTNCSIYNNIGQGSNSSNIGVVGGIDASDGILLINNSMIANNTGAAGAANNADEIRVRDAGAFIDADYNLVRGSSDGASLVQAHNVIGLDPLVDPLTGGLFIGGPSNATQMLILEPRNISPLVNVGNTSFSVDQIGNTRPIGNAADIGAIESTQIGDIQVSGNGSTVVNGSTFPNTADGSDFGAASVVTGSTLRTFEIESLGPNAVTLTGIPLIDITGAHAGDFVVTTDPADLELFQGETTPFVITFDPSAAGLRIATVSIANTDGDDNPFTFDISGIGSIGLVIVESAASTDVTEGGATDTITVSLDTTPVGSITVDVVPGNELNAGAGVGLGQLLTFTDTTPQVVTISAADDTISEGNHSDSITYIVNISNPADTLTGDGVVTTVNITDNDSEIAVSGNGQDIPNGAVDFQFGDNTDFGATRSGSGQVQRSFTITNLSITDLTFGTVTLSGPGAGDFTIIQQPSGPLANSATTDLVIGFTASVDGSRDATVSIPNNDPDENPFTFDISGHGNGNDIVFVDSNATGNNDGSSFVNAFNFLQDALDFSDDIPVPVGINHIWVAGTHRADQDSANPGGTADPTATFTLLNLNMMGGFNGTERLGTERDPETKATTLTGDLGGGNLSSPIASGDLTDATALVDGFHFLSGESGGSDAGAHLTFNGGQATLRGCVFTEAGSTTSIGVTAGSPRIDTCIFLNNPFGVGASGGSVDIRNSRFFNFHNGVFASGTADVTVGNSVFSGGTGQGIAADAGTVAVTNCSFANSLGAITNNGALLTVTNCVTSGNTNGLVNNSGTTNASYSNFAEGAVVGTGNISTAPLFTDPDGADNTVGTLDDDLSIGAGSPCIDLGLDAAAAGLGLATDIVGNARISEDSGATNGTGGSIDMGAYEFQGTTPTGIAIVGNGADIANGDTTPDRADHSDFLAADMGASPERSFTIENRGSAPLTISGISITGANAGDFSVTASGLNSLTPGGSTTFTVEFVPLALGQRIATVTIANSDALENPYTFDITGAGTLGVAFVNRNVVGGAGDGGSWIDAMPHLQDAITAGATTIWVAGTHRPDESLANPAGTGDPSAVFTLNNSEAITGGFGGWERTVAESNPIAWPTTLSGDLSEDDPSVGDNSNRIVDIGSGPTLQNLTISGAIDSAISNNGALTMNGVIVRDSSGTNGGAIFNQGGIVLTDCQFINNSSTFGGAIWNNGGADLVNCRFEGNQATDGGAIHNIGGTDLLNCVLVGNQAANEGAAIFNNSGGSTTALNCTFADNQAGTSGGAVHNDNFFGADNCIFAFNTAAAAPHIGQGGGGVSVTRYCSFTGTALPGAGNIVADPLFTNLAGGNVALQSTSPCIDAGDNTPVFVANLSTDILGNFRVQDLSAAPNTGNGGAPIVDMGAYEFAGNVAFDYGDAPDPNYTTALYNDGPRHVTTGPFLGASVDGEIDAQPSAGSDGDDADGSDDEDGITVLTPATPNQSVDIQVTVGHTQGRLSIWIDGNQDGDFAGEQVLTDHLLLIGTRTVSVPIPASFITGTTVARYRISTNGGLSYTGSAPSGEVEDHPITIVNTAPVAIDDSAAVAHNASVTGNVLSNDNDPNGDSLNVSAVNGVGGNVGTTITLGSGAQVTVDANGGFTYATNGAWNHLTVGQTANDSFVYSASDSVDTDDATVTVTITGVSVARDAVVPGVQNGVGDDFVIFRDGSEIVVTRDGAEVVRQEDVDLDSVTINGTDDDDSLTVDYSGGDPLVGMVFTTFNGVFGTNPVTLSGTIGNQGIHYTATNTNGYTGFAMLDGSQLDFTGVTSLTAANAADSSVFPQHHNTTATLAPGAAGSNSLTGTHFPPTTIPNPGASLTIALGDGGNALSINGLDPAFATDLNVTDGGGTDAITIDATLQTNGGTLTIAGDSIVVIRTISTTGGDVVLNANDGVTLTGSTGDIKTGGGSYTVDADVNDNDFGTYSQSSQNAAVQTAGGNASITAANFALGGTISAGAGNVELIPSLNHSIDLGGTAGAAIVITDAQADRIIAANLSIGNNTVGIVTIVSTFSPGAISNSLEILADGPILGLATVDLIAPAVALFSGSSSISDGVEPIDLQASDFSAVALADVYISSSLPMSVDIAAGNDVFIEAVDLDIVGLDAFGLLDITPLAPSTTIGLGGAVGDLDLGDADLANISPNFAEIFIGNPATTLISVETATFQSTVNFFANRIVDSANLADVTLAPATALFLNGTVAPGASPGNFDVLGHVELVSGSTLELEMAAPADTPGGNFDVISATSVIIHGGVGLDATWTGAAPTPGQAIQFIVTNNLTGEFDALPDGTTYRASGHGFYLDYATVGAAFIANTPPLAADDAVTVAVGNVENIDVLANDGDADTALYGDSFTATALADDPANIGVPLTLPSNAIVTLFDNGSFFYDTNGQFASLDAGDTATDTVTYTITDILDGTGVATVHITIHGASDPPVAVDDAISANEDSPRIDGGLLGNDFDPEGNPFSVTAHNASSTFGANVSVNAVGAYSYDPRVSPTLQSLALGASRTDSFSYTISDLTGSDSANVIVTVHGANDAPIAVDDTDATTEGSVLASGGILGNDSDIDVGDTISARAETIASGRGGSVTIAADGSFSYNGTAVASLQALAAGEAATDSFTYTLSDNNGSTDQASVVITVNGENDAPVAVADSATVAEDNILNGSGILGNDTDVDTNDTHTADVVAAGTSARGANVTIAANGDFSYDGGTAAFAQPLAAGDSMTDSFTYIIRDNNNSTSQGTVVVTIHGSNDGPSAIADFAAVQEHGFLNGNSVLGNDLDSDNGAILTVPSADANSARGIPLTVNPDGTFVYDISGATAFDYLATNIIGTDQFSYVVSDGTSTSVGSVTISVTGINDPLTAQDDTYTTREDDSLTGSTVLINDLDADLADVIRIDAGGTAAGSAHGGHVAVQPDGTFLYDGRFIPGVSALNTGETFVDSFTYLATDGHGSFSGATVTIIIFGEDDAPLANIGGPYTGLEGTPLTVSGAGSTDPNNNITHYFWDFDNDGAYDDASGVTASFSDPADGVHNIGLLVRDATGFTDTATTTVTLTNVVPIAVAGGPYVGAASTVIPISGLGSVDPGNDIVSYAWDLDDDGAFDDANTADTTFSSTFGGTFPIHLRVIDANGESSSDSTTVVTNLSITWENRVNVVTFGSQDENLRKSSGGAWNGSASSVQTLDEDGYLSVQHTASDGKRMIGLSTTEHGTHFNTIEYALYLSYGNLEIFENGVQRGGFGPSLGQELRIEIKNGDIIYWRGASELRRVVAAVSEPFSFVADTSLDTLNSTIVDANLVVPPPQNPQILEYSATDPDNGNTFYSDDDQVSVVFHQKTNMGGYALNQPLTQIQIDNLITFIPAPGTAYTGYWSAKDTLIVDIQLASLTEPALGTAFCVPAGVTIIEHDKAPLAALPTNSPGLGGNWGSVFVKWIEGVNVRIDDNYLQRATPLPNTWNGGAVSSRQIDGDVFFETTVTGRGKHRMIGLGNSNDSEHFNDIDYAFFLHRAGALEGYESGTQVRGMGDYQTNDVLRIEIVGDTLRYLKNSVVLREVTIDRLALGPVQVDTSLNDNGGDFDNTIFVTPDPPPPVIASFVASDPNNDVLGYNVGDAFTINFTQPTTMPAAAISDLFTLSEPLGNTLVGNWLDSQTYQIVVVAAGAEPTIGAATVAPAGTIPIYYENTRVLASNTPATLSGNYGRLRNKLTVAQVSASSTSSGSAQALVDGSGLTAEQHDIVASNMWLSDLETDPSVTVDLGRNYFVSEMALWNYNDLNNGNLGFTATTIERSLDGITWTTAFSGNIPQSAATGPISANRYFNLGATTRFIRVSATGDGPLGLSELCFFSDQVLPPFRWNDAGLGATISDGKLQASFQAGHPHFLSDLNTTTVLLQSNPAALPAVINLFGGSSVDLSQAVVNASSTATSVTVQYLWLNGTTWDLSWSFSGGDLVCTTSATTPTPVTEMAFNIIGADIATFSCVSIDEYGFSHEMDAPFTGTQWAPGDSQPTIAIFESGLTNWAIDGRGVGYIHPLGLGATANLVAAQPQAATTSPSLFDIRIRCGASWQAVAQPHRDWIGLNAPVVPATTPHICHSLVATGASANTTVGPLTSTGDIAAASAQGVGRIIADLDFVAPSNALTNGASIFYVSDFAQLPIVAAAYPAVPLMSQDFNPDSLDYARLALTELPPGHPLAGYLHSPLVEFFTTGQMYAPTTLADLDAHIRWPYFVPGSDPSEPGHNSWSEILDIFHTHNLVSDTVGAFAGDAGVTAQWVSTATTRSLQLIPAGTLHGTRHTNTQSVDLGGGAIDGWLAYNGTNMFGLNPAHTYYVDPLLTLDPLAFHIDTAPGDFLVINQYSINGFDRLQASGTGTLTAVIPADHSAFLDAATIAGPTAIAGAHTIRGFEHSDQFLEGLGANLVGDGDPRSNGVIRGRFPPGATDIRLLVEFVTSLGASGNLTINGVEFVNTTGSFTSNSVDVNGFDLLAFAGLQVVVDLQATGDGEWDTLLFTITGAPPVADIGGPYTIPEGSSIDLDASSSYPAGVATGWDLGGGSFTDASGSIVNFARTASGVYPIGIEVSNGNGTDQAFTTVTVTNVAPTADAGGPYIVAPGDGIPLDGTNSNDPGFDITNFDWDYDGDGNFDDASGATPIFTPVASGTLTLNLRVTDADGATDTNTTTVFSSNDVEWTNFVNTISDNGDLVKTGGGSAWNAGASTVSALNEDGYLGIDATPGGKRMIGLTTTDASPHLSDIDYAFYLNQSSIEIYESGVQRGSFGTFNPGDDLRIYLDRGDVFYTIAGVEVRRNIGVIPLDGFSFVGDASIETLNARIEGVRLVTPPPESPRIILYEGSDPDNLSTDYEPDDAVTIIFHQKTDRGGFATNTVLGRATVDQLFTLNPAPGNDYEGQWLSDDTFQIRIITPAAVAPSFGSASVQVAGTIVINNGKVPLPATNDVILLGGHWGTVIVLWTNPIGVIVDGNKLTRPTSSEGWNMGAASSRTIAGDMYMETIAETTGKNRMIGFAEADTDAHFSSLNYAFFMHVSGALERYESGVQRGRLTTYKAGDILRLEREGTDINYMVNGLVLATSPVDPVLGLKVDCSLNSRGAVINNTRFVRPGDPLPARAASADAIRSAATILLDSGWNLVSIPVTPDDSDPESVFGGTVSTIQGGETVAASSLEPGVGYWVFNPGDARSVVITGEAVTDSPAPGSGWTLFGPVADSANPAALEGATIYSFENGSYRQVDSSEILHATQGYLIHQE